MSGRSRSRGRNQSRGGASGAGGGASSRNPSSDGALPASAPLPKQKRSLGRRAGRSSTGSRRSKASNRSEASKASSVVKRTSFGRRKLPIQVVDAPAPAGPAPAAVSGPVQTSQSFNLQALQQLNAEDQMKLKQLLDDDGRKWSSVHTFRMLVEKASGKKREFENITLKEHADAFDTWLLSQRDISNAARAYIEASRSFTDDSKALQGAWRDIAEAEGSPISEAFAGLADAREKSDGVISELVNSVTINYVQPIEQFRDVSLKSYAEALKTYDRARIQYTVATEKEQKQIGASVPNAAKMYQAMVNQMNARIALDIETEGLLDLLYTLDLSKTRLLDHSSKFISICLLKYKQLQHAWKDLEPVLRDVNKRVRAYTLKSQAMSPDTKFPDSA